MSAKQSQGRHTCLAFWDRTGLVICCKLMNCSLARCANSPHPTVNIPVRIASNAYTHKGNDVNSVFVLRRRYMYHIGYCCVNMRVLISTHNFRVQKKRRPQNAFLRSPIQWLLHDLQFCKHWYNETSFQLVAHQV